MPVIPSHVILVRIRWHQVADEPLKPYLSPINLFELGYSSSTIENHATFLVPENILLAYFSHHVSIHCCPHKLFPLLIRSPHSALRRGGRPVASRQQGAPWLVQPLFDLLADEPLGGLYSSFPHLWPASYHAFCIELFHDCDNFTRVIEPYSAEIAPQALHCGYPDLSFQEVLHASNEALEGSSLRVGQDLASNDPLTSKVQEVQDLYHEAHPAWYLFRELPAVVCSRADTQRE